MRYVFVALLAVLLLIQVEGNCDACHTAGAGRYVAIFIGLVILGAIWERRPFKRG